MSVIVPDGTEHVVDITWFGANNGGNIANDLALEKALAYLASIVTGAPEYIVKRLYFPTGSYLFTEPGILGIALKYKSIEIVGDGERSSIIKFRPSNADAAFYDQTIVGVKGLIGFRMSNIGIILENSNNDRAPVHFIKSCASTLVADGATQRFGFDNVSSIGTSQSTFIKLLGVATNESELVFKNLRLNTYKTLLRSENLEAVNHAFYWCDCVFMFGHVFDYVRGGCLSVYGGQTIFAPEATGEMGLLCIGRHNESIGGQTSQFYNINGIRTELRNPTSRALYMEGATEGQINFDACSFFVSPNNQAFAKIPIQHNANITFRKCVLKKRLAGTSAGTLQFTDNLINNYRYSGRNLISSVVTFDQCNHDGDRVTDDEPFADYSTLTAASINYRSSVVVYRGCDGIPDCVEYGQTTRMARTTSNNVPPRLIFRGEEMPKGDGVNRVCSINSFNVVVPLNNYVSEIHISRPVKGSITDLYSIEFVDNAEWITPGSGIIYGSTVEKAFNLAINESVLINKIFTGTRMQRTIWCRLKTGVTIISPGKTNDGATIWADVF